MRVAQPYELQGAQVHCMNSNIELAVDVVVMRGKLQHPCEAHLHFIHIVFGFKMRRVPPTRSVTQIHRACDVEHTQVRFF